MGGSRMYPKSPLPPQKVRSLEMQEEGGEQRQKFPRE